LPPAGGLFAIIPQGSPGWKPYFSAPFRILLFVRFSCSIDFSGDTSYNLIAQQPRQRAADHAAQNRHQRIMNDLQETLMKLLNQYRGLRREIYVLFFGRIVTNLGSMIWPG
jgi:hypothetical protein